MTAPALGSLLKPTGMLMTSVRLRWFAGFLGLLLIVVSAVVGTPMRWVVFMPPHRTSAEVPRPLLNATGGRTHVHITVPGSSWMDAEWLPARTAPSCGTVMLLHGNAADLLDLGAIINAFGDRGMNTLAIDYRGYGVSPGVPSDSGLRTDARAALRFLRDSLRLEPGQILAVGHSIGATLATDLAALSPPEIAGAVLISPFVSMPEALRARVPFVPVGMLRWEGNSFDARPTLQRMGVPVLVIAGARNRFIPLEHTKQVMALIGPGAILEVIAGRGHNDIFGAQTTWDAITAFRDNRVDCPAEFQE